MPLPATHHSSCSHHAACQPSAARFERCANLTADAVAHWVSHAHGTKSRFFQQVRHATEPFGISGVTQPCAPQHTTSAVPLNVAFVGDSIVGELFQAYRSLVPPASAELFHATNLLSTNHTELVSFLTSKPWHAVFVGGLGLHQLVRLVDWSGSEADLGVDHGNRTLHSPTWRHRSLVRTWIDRLRCLGRALATPVVFVGSLPVDVSVLLLDPPKVRVENAPKTRDGARPSDEPPAPPPCGRSTTGIHSTICSWRS